MLKIRSRLTFANVTAVVALFIALGGSAYAVSLAPKNSVTSKAIVNGQVKSQDLAEGSVGHLTIGHHEVVVGNIKDGAISGDKLGDVFAVTADAYSQQGVSGTVGQDANCPTGSRIISGGAEASGFQATLNASTYGTLTGAGSWYGEVKTGPTGDQAHVIVTALCLGNFR